MLPRSVLPAAVGVAAMMFHTATPAAADVVTIGASRDNTLYQDSAGSVSNGAGQHFFAGTTAGGALRRGLISFDIGAAVPAGATITGVTLTLTMSRGGPSPTPVTLHRVLADWGEGTTDASNEEGQGGLATPGSATWLHRFWDTTLWASPGGDFAGAASGSQAIGGLGAYSWTGAGLVADVQAWLDGTADNLGWALLGNESAGSTAVRFDSRENPLEQARPRLVVEYVPAPGSAALVVGAAGAVCRRRRRA